jgi:hypothetical protein
LALFTNIRLLAGKPDASHESNRANEHPVAELKSVREQSKERELGGVMTLLECVDCGNPISERAPTCPKCGAPRGMPKPGVILTRPSIAKTHPVAAAILGVLLIAAAISSITFYSKSQLPVLPMQVKYRRALLGSGYVLQFVNETDSPLSVAASVAHPATNLGRSYQVNMPPRGTKEIGWLEGWVGQSGDTYTLHNNAYRESSGSIP